MTCPECNHERGRYCDLLRAEQENDRIDYNVAVSNGLIIKARSINRRMNAREREINQRHNGG